MNELQLRQLEDWYDSYVKRFRKEGVFAKIHLEKEAHSRRVAREAGQLASDLGWSEETRRTARIVGLFHDVGRFSQYEEFGTLDDSKSIDHGMRGCQVLLEENALRILDLPEKTRILESIQNHNAKEIPAHLECGSLPYVKLIRDADKADIFRMILRHLEQGTLHEHRELLINVSLDGDYDPALLEYLREGKLVAYRRVRTLQDIFLVLLSWIFDLNYAAGILRLRKDRVFEKIAGYLPENDEIRQIREKVFRLRDERIEQMADLP